MYTDPNMEEIKVARAIFEANDCVYEKQYSAATVRYSSILQSTSHPAAFANRALCYIALGHPHLAVNDSLRAYMTAQHVLSECGSNDETVRFYQQISNYASECHKEIERGTPWTGASAEMLYPCHKDFELAKMTTVSQYGPPKDENPEGDTEALLESPVENLRLKALFRLTYALAKCGRGPAYAALCILEGVFRLTKHDQYKHGIDKADRKQLWAVAQMIQDNLMEDAINATLSDSDHALTLSMFAVMDPKRYEFIEHPIDEAAVQMAIKTVDSNAIVASARDRKAKHLTLHTTQDAFRGSVLFTESLPFIVSTANTSSSDKLDDSCDTCGAELHIPTTLTPLIRAEEERSDRQARATERDTRSTPPDLHVDECLSLSPESNGLEDIERVVPTPPRGRQRSRPAILETSDIQVCRTGDSTLRENFTYCSDECHDTAMSTYHDSICGTYIENYLRTSMIRAEHPELPSVRLQKLTQLTLVRILSWCHATSTDPLSLPAVQLLLASPRHGPLRELPSATWSFHNNVLRPTQMLQAMDGRGLAPRSAVDVDYTDGRVLNTVIGLIQRHLHVSNERRWAKLYSEDGYLEETVAPRREPHNGDDDDDDDEKNIVFFGRLHPLCDLAVVASSPRAANAELVDLGDGRVICIPFPAGHGAKDVCVKKGTQLRLRTAEPRRATADEMAFYARKYDGYAADDVMMDADDEAEEKEEPETPTSDGEQRGGPEWETPYRGKFAAYSAQQQGQEDGDDEMVMD